MRNRIMSSFHLQNSQLCRDKEFMFKFLSAMEHLIVINPKYKNIDGKNDNKSYQRKCEKAFTTLQICIIASTGDALEKVHFCSDHKLLKI